jgi:hypothetical protein
MSFLIEKVKAVVPSVALKIAEEVPKSSYTLFKYFSRREAEDVALASSS